VAYEVEAVVVGAGVIGLAVARALARAGTEVVVLEAERTFGAHSSSRNSEVIHAGLYYPAGSLKARLCVAGRRRLYAWCRARRVGHRQTGKLIVATAHDDPAVLDRILASAANNDVTDLRRLDRAEVRALEPDLDVAGALLSPSTGIVDSHGVMQALLADAEDRGAMVAWSTSLVSARPDDGGFVVTAGGDVVRCRILVNAAGLGAQAVAGAIEGMPADAIPTRYLAKGTYFSLRGRCPFSRLIYPVPATASLGVHLTLDLAGAARFGPDQEWVDTIDYAADERRGDAFYAAVRRYWPGLPDGALQADYAGIRAKVQAPGTAMADFVIAGPETHGLPGLVNLFGIESPGLTACLPLADEVLARLHIAPPEGDA
jgi:L-2-hydroxyglutarate oxidase LhgO